MRRLLPILGILVMLTVPCLGENREKTYCVKATIPFRITLPANWRQVPEDALRAIMTKSESTVSGPHAYKQEIAFQSPGHRWLARPYFLVSVVPSPKGEVMTERIANALVSDMNARPANGSVQGEGEFRGQVVASISTSSVSYRPELHEWFTEVYARRKRPTVERFGLLCCRKFTKAGILTLQFYTDEDSFGREKPLLYRIAKSIQVDASIEIRKDDGERPATKR